MIPNRKRGEAFVAAEDKMRIISQSHPLFTTTKFFQYTLEERSYSHVVEIFFSKSENF
jgi:hypothetical protein